MTLLPMPAMSRFMPRFAWRPRGGLNDAQNGVGASMASETLHIINRPEEIKARSVPAHCKGDLLKGAFDRAPLGPLVWRMARFGVPCKTDGNGAAAALESVTAGQPPAHGLAKEHDL